MNDSVRKDAPCILLVEDDPGDQDLTRRAVTKGDIEITLTIAGDGAQALEMLANKEHFAALSGRTCPDLILLDLNLPKIDGYKVLETIRSTPELKRIPVVALTTSRQEEDIAMAYSLGVNSFLTKPNGLTEYIESLTKLVHYWFRVVALPPRGERVHAET